MNCSICFDDIGCKEEAVGCGFHNFHTDCVHCWSKSRTLDPSKWKECFICQKSIPTKSILQIMKINNDPMYSMISACHDDNLELLKTLTASVDRIYDHDFLEMVKVSLEVRAENVVRYLKEYENNRLSWHDKKKLIEQLWQRPSSARLNWILNDFWTDFDLTEGKLGPTILAAFVKSGAYLELYYVFSESFSDSTSRYSGYLNQSYGKDVR